MKTKSKTKIFGVLACVAFVLALGFAFCLKPASQPTAYVAAAEISTISELQEDSPQDSVPTTPVEPAENNTFFGRIWQWLVENKTDLIAGLGNVILGIFMLVNYIKSEKNFANITKGVTNTSSSQADVVEVTNKLIAEYNKLKESTDKFTDTEDERYKILASAVVQIKAVLDILCTVYANSKNIPQGVKDLVNLKYADALKIIGDEQKLLSVAESSVKEEKTAEGESGSKTEV